MEMATKSQAQALKKLEDQLTCAICLDAFKDPKLLQCFHVYCKECLERLVVQDQQGQVSVRCPTCRRSTLLPPSTTVAHLQSAFHIHHLFEIQDAFEKMREPQNVRCDKCTKLERTATSYCRDCGEFICAACTDIHAQWDTFTDHEVVALNEFEKKVKQLDTLKKVTLYCSLHQDKKLELYCESCEELICHNCIVKKHKDHQYDLITDTFEQQKAEITASLEPVEMRLETINKAIGQIATESKAVEANRGAIEAEINRKINELQDTLELRKAELICELNDKAQQSLKKLATQKDALETIQTQLVSCLAFVRESLRTVSQGEILQMKKGVLRQIKEITNSIELDQLPSCESPHIAFSSLPELAESCRHFGEICCISYATGKGLEVAVRGEETTATLHICDKQGRVHPKPVESLTCELVSDAKTDKIKGSLKKTKDGQYEVSYQPTCRGRHQLHIKIEGEHIKGSPFGITVKIPVQELGTPVRTFNEVDKPWGVAINQQGEVVVAECERNCLSIFSATGDKIRSFGSAGSDHGQFDSPRGVAVDNDGNILVVDSRNSRIQKFSADGRFLAAVGTHGSDQLQFKCPIGIKINPRTKRIYVADQSNQRVQVLRHDLTFCSNFGSRGDGPGHLYNPCDVAFDSANNIYVADLNNHRIQVFTENGGFLRQIGRRGTGNGELKFPVMIAVDNEDRVFVTELGNLRVSVFTSEGNYLVSFGTWGKEPQQFQHPCGITIDKSEMVYVCDYGKDCVQIF